MPRSPKNAELSPKAPPKAKTMRTTEAATKRASKAEPENTQKRASKLRARPAAKIISNLAPVRAPVPTVSEIPTIAVYSLPEWNSNHSISPHHYGNGGKQLAEFPSEQDAKHWLRINGQFGHYAFVERRNGRIGASWHVEIEPPEEEAGFDADLTGEDLASLDEDDLDQLSAEGETVPIRELHLRTKLAKLEGELKSRTNGGSQSSIAEMVQALKSLDELRGAQQPQKSPIASLVEEIAALEKAKAILMPRAPNPAPAPAPESPEVKLLDALLSDDGFISKVVRKYTGDNGSSGGDESTLKIILEQAPAACQAFGQFVVAPVVSAFQVVRQENEVARIRAQAGPQSQPQMGQPQPVLTQQTSPQAMPEQPQHGRQPIGQNADIPPGQALLNYLIGALAQNSPVEQVAAQVRYFIIAQPELGESVDELLNTRPQDLLSMACAIHPPVSDVPGALDWLKLLQEALMADDEDDPESEK